MFAPPLGAGKGHKIPSRGLRCPELSNDMCAAAALDHIRAGVGRGGTGGLVQRGPLLLVLREVLKPLRPQAPGGLGAGRVVGVLWDADQKGRSWEPTHGWQFPKLQMVVETHDFIIQQFHNSISPLLAVHHPFDCSLTISKILALCCAIKRILHNGSFQFFCENQPIFENRWKQTCKVCPPLDAGACLAHNHPEMHRPRVAHRRSPLRCALSRPLPQVRSWSRTPLAKCFLAVGGGNSTQSPRTDCRSFRGVAIEQIH